DRFDESSIAINFFSGTFPNSFRGIAQLLKLRSNIGFRLWSYEFTSTDQHSNDAGRLRIDRERKDTISVGLRNDVKKTQPFFVPGIAPRIQHGIGFLLIKALAHQNCFELRAQRIQLLASRRAINRRLGTIHVEQAETDLTCPVLEKNCLGQWLSGQVTDYDFRSLNF